MTNRMNKSIEFYNEYVDCTQNLPLDIQRHVTQMRNFDMHFQEMMSKVKNLTESFKGNVSSANAAKLTKLLVTGLDIGDRKVQTLQTISDLAEDKVMRLENGKRQLASMKDPDVPKQHIKDKPETSSCSKERCLPSTSTSSATKELKKRNTDNDGNETNNDLKIAKRPRRNRADEPDYKEISDDVVVISSLQHSHTPLPRATATAQVQSQVTFKKTQKTEKQTKKKGKYKKQQKDNSPSIDDDEELAVDPDEPTYCLCDQISYGEMICCDNDLCPIEWFHFSCVSLSTKPKGKWFCPKCRGDRPNTMKPKAQFLKELERYNKEKEDKA
ncbi:Zinc finger, PHD-type,Zinc finger, FYVE/PHD-type,Inhibitor of growth protein, N-terminal histone- [Cinara cedri]|uniref:Inhibitor of growth protein n=1 Tax=Cinara cedri TaxID=506608 RepID=A0A5E4N3J1_9HEMI|nr:Zinc finger, PHD-type,Zinc finger, FYVE/PHD-type,Inhibitor of growth protein, N-terminal histone- [Cinara cedri]